MVLAAAVKKRKRQIRSALRHVDSNKRSSRSMRQSAALTLLMRAGFCARTQWYADCRQTSFKLHGTESHLSTACMATTEPRGAAVGYPKVRVRLQRDDSTEV